MKHALGLISCVGLLGLAMAANAASQDPQTSGPPLDSAAVDALDVSVLGTFTERIQRGFDISPVRLDLRGKDPSLVGYGSYLVNAGGGCNDCHTNPPYLAGGNPFLGQPERINAARYLAGGTSFGPQIVSRNLTPRSNGLPANLTFEQFRITMRTGVDMKHRPPFVPSSSRDILQVMPWPVYGHLRRIDLQAIYDYLRAIPPLPTTPATP